jgi:hypothetical protein
MGARAADWKGGWPDWCLLCITFMSWRIERAQPHPSGDHKGPRPAPHDPRPYEC